MNRKERRSAEREAAKKAKQHGGKIRIEHLIALWKNNARGGVGVTIEWKEMDGWRFAQKLLDALKNYDGGGATPDDLISQLKMIGQMDEHDETAQTVAVMNINWMVERGHLKADEYNGLSWHLIHEGRNQQAITEQNPLTIDLEAAFDTGLDVTTEFKAGAVEAVQAVSDWAREQNRDHEYFMILIAEMKDGDRVLRRFHMTLAEDPRGLKGENFDQFIVNTLAGFGYAQMDLKNRGSVPIVALHTFDTEAECKKEYDRLVAQSGAVTEHEWNQNKD